MRFLRSAAFELDAKGEAALAKEIEDFLRVGVFSPADWDSLSVHERELAVAIKKALKLEEVIQLRSALQASTLEDAAALLRSGGDEAAASHLFLQDAVRKLSTAMDTADFAGAHRE